MSSPSGDTEDHRAVVESPHQAKNRTLYHTRSRFESPSSRRLETLCKQCQPAPSKTDEPNFSSEAQLFDSPASHNSSMTMDWESDAGGTHISPDAGSKQKHNDMSSTDALVGLAKMMRAIGEPTADDPLSLQLASLVRKAKETIEMYDRTQRDNEV